MSAVTREALIEAAARVLDTSDHGYAITLGQVDNDDIAAVLDAVLPMLGLDSDSLPVPVVECPNCGASIRARMPDDPDA